MAWPASAGRSGTLTWAGWCDGQVAHALQSCRLKTSSGVFNQPCSSLLAHERVSMGWVLAADRGTSRAVVLLHGRQQRSPQQTLLAQEKHACNVPPR